MVDVSVILPVYNVESYLKKAIKSVINQTHRNIEIIIVNDGSTDNSGEICETFASQDSRIKIIHQPNKGVGPARNIGLSMATGLYVYFMDPDDFIDSKLIEENLEMAKRNNANIVIFGYSKVIQKNNRYVATELKTPDISDVKSVKEFKEIFKPFFDFGAYTVWNRIYKREFLINNRLMYRNQSIGQDALFNLEVFKKNSEGIYFNQNHYYYYVDRPNSSVNRYHNNRFEKQFEIIKNLNELLEQLDYSSPSKEQILYKEYLGALYSELKNLTSEKCKMKPKLKTKRIEEILMKNQEISDAIINSRNNKEYSLMMKLILFSLQKRFFKLSLLLVKSNESLKKILKRPLITK